MSPLGGRSTKQTGAASHPFISLLLVIHLVIVVVVLAANMTPRSLLLERLTQLFRPYAGPLHLDPDRQLYHLTYPSEIHDDHFVDVLVKTPSGEQAIPITTAPDHLSATYRRHKNLARMFASLCYAEGRLAEAKALEIAKAIGTHVLEAEQVDSVVVRCSRRRHQEREPLPQDIARNPDNQSDPIYNETLYRAQVWKDGTSIEAIKLSDRAQVALPESN